MPESAHLPVPDELAASLRRVVKGKQPETVYDSQGTPVAILMPTAEPAPASTQAQFLQQFRTWRDGDPEEQRRAWEQLEAVLKEERDHEPLS